MVVEEGPQGNIYRQEAISMRLEARAHGYLERVRLVGRSRCKASTRSYIKDSIARVFATAIHIHAVALLLAEEMYTPMKRLADRWRPAMKPYKVLA